jgi:hypothetical protein
MAAAVGLMVYAVFQASGIVALDQQNFPTAATSLVVAQAWSNSWSGQSFTVGRAGTLTHISGLVFRGNPNDTNYVRLVLARFDAVNLRLQRPFLADIKIPSDTIPPETFSTPTAADMVGFDLGRSIAVSPGDLLALFFWSPSPTGINVYYTRDNQYATGARLASMYSPDGMGVPDDSSDFCFGTFVDGANTSNSAPVVYESPFPRTAPAGAPVRFHSFAAGSPQPSYQWLLNGLPIPSQTAPTLSIASLRAEDAGLYSVLASNRWGSAVSRGARLDMLGSPIILQQPASQTVIAGTAPTFQVRATGTPPLDYHWRCNGKALPGATGSTLTVANAQSGRAGDYTVTVGNAVGVVTSSVATLTVRYRLTLNTVGGGDVRRDPALPDYPLGLAVTLTPIAGAGYVFSSWSGNATGDANPLRVDISTNLTITANFVSTALAIVIEGEGIVRKAPDEPFYAVGQLVSLTAEAGRWHAFTRWGDGVTANPRVVTVGLSNTYRAIFSPTTDLETLTYSNVSRLAPVGMPAVFVDGAFVSGGSVAREGSARISLLTTFTNGSILYTLDGSTPAYFSSPYSGPWTMNRSATIRALAYDATFTQSWEADPVHVVITPTYPLVVSSAGGGTVTLAPFNTLFPSNTMVALRAVPAPGWSFLQWLGDAIGSDMTTAVRMTRPKSVEAVFGTTLTTTVAGAGSVERDPTSALYPCGTVVRLTGLPQPGNAFALWGNATAGTNNPLLFVVSNASPSVSALFAPLAAGQRALTVLAHGVGHVTLKPRANQYADSQAVTLTAMPDEGQQFLGWSGDAEGTQNPVAALMNQNRTITATFTRRARLRALGVFADDGSAELQLQIVGWSGDQYGLEQSDDLQQWHPWIVATNCFGTVQVSDTLPTNAPRRFYRVEALVGQ